MSFSPDPERIRWYQPGRRPYVEISLNERQLHARILGWQGEMILVEYPPRIESRFSYGQRETAWIHKSRAVRLRWEDSLWADLEDDNDWHQWQDLRISFRRDPWTIYSQENPPAGS